MKKLALGAALAAATITTQSLADTMEIKFASPSPPRAHLNVQVFGPWTKEVNAAAKGAFKINLVAGPVLASHRNLYDRVRTNVANAGWSIQSFVPGKFPRSDVVALPFTYEKSIVGSTALWKIFQSGLIAGEYSEVKVLALFAFPPNGLHANVPIKNLEDLDGLKIGTGGPIRLAVVSALGATPISMVPPEVYQNISRGLVKGTMMGWTAFQPYRLAEVTNHHLEAPMGGNPGMIIMNKGEWNKLPAAGQKVLADYSYDRLVERYAKFWDRIMTGTRDKIMKNSKHTVSGIDPAERPKWIARLKHITDEWVTKTPDGAKVLEAFNAEAEKVEKGMMR